MRVLVTGAAGQLGVALCQAHPDTVQVVATDAAELDICDHAAAREAFNHIRPDCVINAAAFTAVDAAESRRDEAFAVNAEAPAVLAQLCAERGARLVHVSTDFVFDGKQSKPYLPSDVASPLSVYGQSKYEGEQRALGDHDNVLIIRTSWVYGVHGHNFVKTMLRLMQEKGSVRVVSDQVGTPTHSRSLARAIWSLVQGGTVGGVHHFTDAGVASWYDFAEAIADLGVEAGLLTARPKVDPILTADFPTPAARPSYSVLDKSSTWGALGYKSAHWRTELASMLSELARTRHA